MTGNEVPSRSRPLFQKFVESLNLQHFVAHPASQTRQPSRSLPVCIFSFLLGLADLVRTRRAVSFSFYGWQACHRVETA